RVHALAFTCVVDPKTTPANVRILASLGAQVEIVTEPDEHGCYLAARLRRVAELCREAADRVWINQYANERNWQAHYHGTAAEIDEVVSVSDREAVDGCRALAISEGILAGGSSGAVVAAIERLRPRFPAEWQVLTVLPDRGDRYLDQVYDDAWVDRLADVQAV